MSLCTPCLKKEWFCISPRKTKCKRALYAQSESCVCILGTMLSLFPGQVKLCLGPCHQFCLWFLWMKLCLVCDACLQVMVGCSRSWRFDSTVMWRYHCCDKETTEPKSKALNLQRCLCSVPTTRYHS